MKKPRFLFVFLMIFTLFLASCAPLENMLSSILASYTSSESMEDTEGFSDEEDSSSVEKETWECSDEPFSSSEEDSDSADSESEESVGGSEEDKYTYNSFTASEKKAFTDLIGEVIPFLPNNEYYVDNYEYEGEESINFYTFNNTQAEYDAYRSAFSAYTLVETGVDDYGDTYYIYQKGEIYVDMSFYEIEGSKTCVDVYVYILEGSGGTGDNENGGSTGGNENNGTLPEGENGVYSVDLKKATNVKDVTDQGYYLDGCPTIGTPGVLVIPVEFSDVTAASKGYKTSVLKQAFQKNGQTDYYSVYDYYNTASYGQLNINVTVLDTWFRPRNNSTYYQNATIDYFGEQVAAGDQMIMDEALAYLETTMDLSAFDSDKNGIIDAVVLINTLDVGDDDFHWAYRYWNIYTNDNDEYYEYDGVSANDYLWASYQFLYSDYDSYGNENYNNKNGMNTYTYIHEFGHILGADDYYDTAGVNEPMGGFDIMDAMVGDHNAFTKFNLGWVTTSRLVTTDTSVTLSLEDFSKNGDSIIIANNWDATLGAYQEYYVLAYYKSVGLNSGMGGYFERDGVVVYHVNATLSSEVYDGVTYYDIKNSNTDRSSEYGSVDNLIEYVLSADATYTYAVGDRLPSVTDDNGNRLQYTFTVDALSSDAATITFTKI